MGNQDKIQTQITMKFFTATMLATAAVAVELNAQWEPAAVEHEHVKYTPVTTTRTEYDDVYRTVTEHKTKQVPRVETSTVYDTKHRTEYDTKYRTETEKKYRTVTNEVPTKKYRT